MTTNITFADLLQQGFEIKAAISYSAMPELFLQKAALAFRVEAFPDAVAWPLHDEEK